MIRIESNNTTFVTIKPNSPCLKDMVAKKNPSKIDEKAKGKDCKSEKSEK